jgi:hypothetical protein
MSMMDVVSAISLVVVGLVGFYTVMRAVTVTRECKRMSRESHLGAQDALARLEALRQLRLGVVEEKAPARPLDALEREELESMRACGFSWAELEEYAAMWGMDTRSVATERRRIEDALRGGGVAMTSCRCCTPPVEDLGPCVACSAPFSEHRWITHDCPPDPGARYTPMARVLSRDVVIEGEEHIPHGTTVSTKLVLPMALQSFCNGIKLIVTADGTAAFNSARPRNFEEVPDEVEAVLERALTDGVTLADWYVAFVRGWVALARAERQGARTGR